MGRLVVIEYVSVDGVIQAPGHAQEDVSGGFTRGGWTGPFMDDHGGYMREALNVMGALLLGRLTYDIWASYWPTVTDPADEIARMLNSVPKYVASTTIDAGLWPQTTVLADVDRGVRELKREHRKDIVVMGSANLTQTLMRLDAVDEYRLMVHPVVLGEGKRLFRNGVAGDFALSSATTTTTGLVTLVYRTRRDP